MWKNIIKIFMNENKYMNDSLTLKSTVMNGNNVNRALRLLNQGEIFHFDTNIVLLCSSG